MTLSVHPVDPVFIHQTWPLVSRFLYDALEQGDASGPECQLYTIEHVKQFLSDGTWLLVVAVDEQNTIHGAATVSFANYPLHRVAFVTAIGGKLIVSKDTFAQFDKILIERGATLVQAFGRESIVRLWRRYNFKACNTMVERLL